MEGPQIVSLGHQIPHILVVVFIQHDAKFGRQLAPEEVSEEDVGLLVVRACLQHGGEQLRGVPGTKGLHLEELVDLLVVSELMSLKQSGLKLCIRCEERRNFDQVQDSPNALLAE